MPAIYATIADKMPTAEGEFPMPVVRMIAARGTGKSLATTLEKEFQIVVHLRLDRPK